MEVTVKPLHAGDICHYSAVMLTVVQTTACFGESAYLECTGEPACSVFIIPGVHS